LVTNTLALVAKENMEKNILEDIWVAHFVDRRVKAFLRKLVESADKGLVRLIRKRSSKLTPKEIVSSLRRLVVRIESPPLPTEMGPASKPPSDVKKRRLREAGKKAAATRQEMGPVTLGDIISAGLLSPPVRLFRKYKGQMLEAELQPDGDVKFNDRSYPSCSTAAERARETVVGRRMNTNGWDFWQFEDEKGKRCTLNNMRRAFVSLRKGKNSPEK
jgi:hypothetical protein